MAKIAAICRSDKKGTAKYTVEEAVLKENWGIEGDAHAGKWHRQISLLSKEKIDEFNAKGANVTFGAFGENLVVEGLDLRSYPVGTRLAIGEILLEVTQLGKECHDHCAIYYSVGECIMPKQGIFAEVLKGGTVRVGDEIKVIPAAEDRPFTAAVITLSDRASHGLYEDKSGPLIEEILTAQGYKVVERLILPDDKGKLKRNLIRLADQRQVDFILTTGGTGFSERDITPEATEEVCERKVPGIPMAILAKSLEITPKAMLSRQTAGIRGRSLIVNLPGSPKACREDLDIILPAMDHGLGILRGTADA